MALSRREVQRPRAPRLPSWGKLSEISRVLSTRTSERLCRAVMAMPEKALPRGDLAGRVLETKLALQCMTSSLSYLTKRTEAVVQCVTDARAAHTSKSKSPSSGTANEVDWDRVDAAVTNEVSAVADLIASFVAGYTYLPCPLRGLLGEALADTDEVTAGSLWMEVSGALFTSFAELLKFYGYLGEVGEALLLEVQSSTLSSSVPSLLDRLGALVHALLDVTSAHFTFGASVEYSSIDATSGNLKEIKLGEVSKVMLRRYFQEGPLMLLQLLSLHHFVARWLVEAETLQTNTAQQLVGNKVYRDVKDRIHRRVTEFVSDFVALEEVLTSYVLRDEDTSLRCPPGHSCCVPIAVLGNEVRQLHTSFGMLLALRSEATLTSFPVPLPAALKRRVSDFAPLMLSLLSETALISLHRTEMKCTRLTSEFVSFLQHSPSKGDSKVKRALVGRLLTDYLQSTRTSYTPRALCPSLSAVYLQAVSSHRKWHAHQWKLLGNFLAYRAECINIVKCLEEAKCDEVHTSTAARLYMCTSLSYGAVSELCRRGLERHEIVKLLLCRDEASSDPALHKFCCGDRSSAHFVSASGLRAVLCMQRALQCPPVGAPDGQSNEVGDDRAVRHGALSHQIKLFLLQRYSFNIIEQSLLNKVQSSVRALSAVPVAHFLSGGISDSKVSASVPAAMVSWQQEAAALHKQLRTLLHEGK